MDAAVSYYNPIKALAQAQQFPINNPFGSVMIKMMLLEFFVAQRLHPTFR
jgi:hypothetical protein